MSEGRKLIDLGDEQAHESEGGHRSLGQRPEVRKALGAEERRGAVHVLCATGRHAACEGYKCHCVCHAIPVRERLAAWIEHLEEGQRGEAIDYAGLLAAMREELARNRAPAEAPLWWRDVTEADPWPGGPYEVRGVAYRDGSSGAWRWHEVQAWRPLPASRAAEERAGAVERAAAAAQPGASPLRYFWERGRLFLRRDDGRALDAGDGGEGLALALNRIADLSAEVGAGRRELAALGAELQRGPAAERAAARAAAAPDGGAGARDIAAERARQLRAEGWAPEHDDLHTRGQLAAAAACYAWPGRALIAVHVRGMSAALPAWPWDATHDRREVYDRRRALVVAGALLAAEIDRLDRAAARGVVPGAIHGA